MIRFHRILGQAVDIIHEEVGNLTIYKVLLDDDTISLSVWSELEALVFAEEYILDRLLFEKKRHKNGYLNGSYHRS